MLKTIQEKIKSPAIKIFLSSLAFLFFTILIIAFFLGRETVQGEKLPYQDTQDREKETVRPQSKPLPVEKVIDLEITSGDTLYTLLASLGISSKDILNINHSAKKVYNLKKLLPGSVLKVTFEGNEFKKLEYPVGETNLMVVEKTLETSKGVSPDNKGTEFVAYKKELVFDKRLVLYKGTIEGSLYESAQKAGMDAEVIMLLSDVYAWEIDFAVDIRKGDSFKVLYEESLYDGKVVKKGPIIASEIINNGNRFRAFYFKDPDGHVDYYDDDGKSLRKQFLKSPLHYRRISSYFSKRRYHPILKRYRPHHGIDYAAPTGTPVRTTGDGKVVFAGWKSGYGRFVVVKHNGLYSTAYGHLSRFGKGIRVGRYVKQGRIIGYVGSTGISTGPHLHYEFRVRNKFVNPLNYRFPSARPVRSKYIQAFNKKKESLLALLERKDDVKVAVLSEKQIK